MPAIKLDDSQKTLSADPFKFIIHGVGRKLPSSSQLAAMFLSHSLCKKPY